jgi:hypothetical protein
LEQCVSFRNSPRETPHSCCPLWPPPSALAGSGMGVASCIDAANEHWRAGGETLVSVDTARNTWHGWTGRRGTKMLRVKKFLPVFGGIVYVALSVLFGSVWFAALSAMLTKIEP